MSSCSTSDVLSAAAAFGQTLRPSIVALTLSVLNNISPKTSTSSSSSSEQQTTFTIGSRSSELALIQSRHVQSLLAQHFSDQFQFRIVSTSSAGDDNQSQPLDVLAQQNAGLFTKSLEAGLLQNR